MGKKVWAKIKPFFGWVWNFLPVGLALLTFLWILFAAVIWPSQNTRNVRASFNLDDGRRLEVWGPAVVPLETPVDLYFALYQEEDSFTPLTLQVTIPEDLVALSPSPNPLAGQVALAFNGNSPEETLVIRLANARQDSGPGTTRQAISVQQAPGEEVEAIEINVEQTWRGVLRQGGGGAVPLGPLITLVSSLGTLLYQYISRSREEKEKSAQAAKEKEWERARQAEESLRKIRQGFQEKNLEMAEKNLIQIEQQGLEAYLEAGDLALARQLLQLAKGNVPSLSFDSLSQEWLEAAGGAVLYAARHNLSDRAGLEQLMRSFPADKLKDSDLRSEWQAVYNNIGAEIPAQAREWPRPTPEPWPTFTSSRTGMSHNPFPCERAEEEERYLFASPNGLFWSGHRVFQALKEQRSLWIVGESGSGKTALALAVGKYLLSDQIFSEHGFGCYFKGLPPVSEIRRTLAGRLLDVILRSPSYLPIGEGQHRLLAEVLLTVLPASLILGRVEQTASASDWPWLKQAKNDTQSLIWQAEARTRLRLLEEAVHKGVPLLPEPVWPQAWSVAIHFLDFELCTRLAFDLDASPASARRESATLDTLAGWTEYGIYSLVFSLPDKHLERTLTGWTSHLKLTWNETEMSEMVKWRWKQVYPTREFESLFENPEAETFFFRQAQGNPARWIRLWNRLIQPGTTLPIPQGQIEAVANSL